MDRGLLPQWVLTDPDVWALEQERVFPRTWQFLGHESEVPVPGAFVTRWMVHDPVLVVRGEDGEIRAFLNACPHRGTLLCTADAGTQAAFTCPYHGWTFDAQGALIGVALAHQVWGTELCRAEWGLKPIPRLERYQGLLFGTLDPAAPPLVEYLGAMTWYLDLLVGRSGGMEVWGPPHRWVVAGNWKLLYENFTGDPYHVQSTHRSTVELGITPQRVVRGWQVVLPHGHGINVTQYLEVPERPYQRTPEALWPRFREHLNPVQEELLRRAAVLVGGIFPTLSFVSPLHGTGEDLYNFLNLRVWRPLAPDRVEVWSWCLVDRAAPEAYKRAAYKAYVDSFGPSGTLEQDDTEMWARVMQASRGWMVRDKTLNYNNVINYLMGFGRVEPDPTFPGPGTAYPGFVDAVSRSTHRFWLHLLTDGAEEGSGEA
ncbi:MAG: Rieske 2Fe-2S domain-containing protein [Firmicutes bacterium]|nr:Rieske 2Fe-2S domain-containing protein [Alicyclobacillaceae bacterium]MCL6498298.1 Rieske 2Fe-2S domain-containing protein [Bacillota bacterium]